ncbi:MAG: nucleotide exchange factor GrpE, partial [Candidatus Omnitrophica bacterium]|nr:nucleotide exchange factor GrpE [Candidatus Omnitrophota bacterium]
MREELKKNQKEEKEHSEPEKDDKLITLKESEYLKLKEEADKAQEYFDRILRLQADFDNIRKRMEKERQEFVKFANEG